MKGRPSDPRRAKRRTGHRRQAGDAAAPGLQIVPAEHSALPAAPEDLPAEAGEMWVAVVEDLVPRGLTTPMLFNVELLVMAAYRHRQARRKIDELGILVKGQRGPMLNPLIRMERDEAILFMRIAGELGLTLSARVRLGLLQLAGHTMADALAASLDED